MHISCLVIALMLFVTLDVDASAFVGAFWLGVDAKVETMLKVDQRVLDTINNLPLEVRKQTVAAANEVIEKLDQKIKENTVLLSAEIERVSLQAAIQWECTAKNVLDKFFEDLRGLLPRWRILADRCEQKFFPDKIGPGPAEKVKIAECWIYEALPLDASPSIIADKLSNLELMSADAACRLRETQSGKAMWKTNAELGLRFSTWFSLGNSCRNPKECYISRDRSVTAVLVSSDSRDIGAARERVEKSASIVSGERCGLQCYEDALVELYLASSEVERNKKLRDTNAKVVAQKGIGHLASARQNANQARKAAGGIGTIRQYHELATASRRGILDARDSARQARATSNASESIAVTIDSGAVEVEKVLLEAETVAKSTILAEEKRKQEQAKKAGRIFRDRPPWERFSGAR